MIATVSISNTPNHTQTRKLMYREWTRRTGTLSGGAVSDICVGQDGFFYATGVFEGGLDGSSCNGSSDAFLIKYRNDGQKIWTQTLGSPGMEDAFCVEAAPDGSVYISGLTDGALNGNSAVRNTFLAKYSSEGQNLWVRFIDAPDWSYVHNLAVSSDGHVYISGGRNGDISISKFQSDGAISWVRTIGGADKETGGALALSGDGSLYVTGGTMGDLDGFANKN